MLVRMWRKRTLVPEECKLTQTVWRVLIKLKVLMSFIRSVMSVCLQPHRLSFAVSWSLLKLMSIESLTLFIHLVLCHPLLLLHSIFSSIRVFSSESVLRIRWPEYWNFSFSIGPSNEYSGLISFRTDWCACVEVSLYVHGVLTCRRGWYRLQMMLLLEILLLKQTSDYFISSTKSDLFLITYRIHPNLLNEFIFIRYLRPGRLSYTKLLIFSVLLTYKNGSFVSA